MRPFFQRIAVIAIIASLLVPTSAGAATVAELKAELERLKNRNAAAGREYSEAYWRLDETEVRLFKTNAKLGKTRKELVAAKKQLNERLNGMYRRDPLGMLNILLGADSFEEFATRADYLRRIGVADAEAIAEVKALQRRLVAQQEALRSEKETRAADVRKFKAQRDRLQKRLRAAESEFRQVKRRLDAARSAGPTLASTISAPGPNGMVFPVAGSYYYADTWGASRSGGRRRHKGTDIMSPHGTPCVAVASGTITSKEGGLGGKTIWLTADNGWMFYYAHLQGWAVRSGRVRAGQVIGYVGSTGNATASAPHLHFEIHPGGGAAINPYPYLRSME